MKLLKPMQFSEWRLGVPRGEAKNGTPEMAGSAVYS
jgi:hypothetical protein